MRPSESGMLSTPTTPSGPTPHSPDRLSLPHAGYPLIQVLQIAGRFYQSPLPPVCSEELRCSRVPSLPGNYPSSSLLRTHPPPSRHPSLSRLKPVIGRTCSRDFSRGRGGLLQLLDMPWPPCCPYHPAGVSCRFGQPATGPAAFARQKRARPPELFFCRGHLGVHFRCGPVTHSPSQGWLGRSASSVSFPPRMRSKLRGS